MVDWTIKHKQAMKRLRDGWKRGFVGLSSFVLGAMLCASCTSEGSPVVVDNPSSRLIRFVVDDTPYKLEPKSSMEIPLAVGEHRLTTPSGKHIAFTKQEYEEKSLLNPLEKTYVIVTTVYTDKEHERNFWLEQMYRLIELNGRYYYGPLQLITAPYTARLASGDPWEYGLDEDFEDRLRVNAGNSTSINIRKAKIYRAEDFERAHADLEVDPSAWNKQ